MRRENKAICSIYLESVAGIQNTMQTPDSYQYVPANYREDAEEVILSPEAQKVWDAAKLAKDEFTGVDASHLTPAERKTLALKGLSFSENRTRKIVATYPARLRQVDFKNRVTARRSTDTRS